MRLVIGSLAAAYWVFAANAAISQPVANGISADEKDIGKIQVQVHKYEQALGVVMQLTRPQSSSVECNGVCYFPNCSRPVTWKCEPERKCDLRCTIIPPGGGCN